MPRRVIETPWVGLTSCASAGAGTAVLVAVSVFGMPVSLAGMSFLYGVGFGVLKIAWIVLAAVYLYAISVFTGQFEIMKESVAGITADRRLQLLLVAFCFGAFIEGAAGVRGAGPARVA